MPAPGAAGAHVLLSDMVPRSAAAPRGACPTTPLRAFAHLASPSLSLEIVPTLILSRQHGVLPEAWDKCLPSCWTQVCVGVFLPTCPTNHRRLSAGGLPHFSQPASHPFLPLMLPEHLR